jgi:hypothetical protein
MKTVVISFKTPADGDLIIIEYSDVRGGVTSAMHRVVGGRTMPNLDADGFVTGTQPIAAQTPKDIALRLAGIVRSEWMNEAFEARVGGVDSSSLIIGCTGLVDNVRFKAFVEGAGGTTVEVMEL